MPGLLHPLPHPSPSPHHWSLSPAGLFLARPAPASCLSRRPRSLRSRPHRGRGFQRNAPAGDGANVSPWGANRHQSNDQARPIRHVLSDPKRRPDQRPDLTLHCDEKTSPHRRQQTSSSPTNQPTSRANPWRRKQPRIPSPVSPILRSAASSGPSLVVPTWSGAPTPGTRFTGRPDRVGGATSPPLYDLRKRPDGIRTIH